MSEQASRNTIRVGVVDDHAILRASLAQLLAEQDGMELVAEAASGREAIDLVRQRRLDVLVMDLAMPGQSGMDVIASIRAKDPAAGILVLSAYGEEQYAVSLLKQGASGYLSKGCDPSEIVQAIRVIAAGHRYISTRVAELLAQELGDALEKSPHHDLTDREMQVLLRLARGQTTREVAQQLCLSGKTVSTYRTRIMEKLGLHSNAEVTYYAMKHRLID